MGRNGDIGPPKKKIINIFFSNQITFCIDLYIFAPVKRSVVENNNFFITFSREKLIKIVNLSKKYIYRTMTGVTGGGTVVYGVDEEFVKSTEGILSIIKIICGLMAWILMAALPYTKMIYTAGETGPFHAVMACM